MLRAPAQRGFAALDAVLAATSSINCNEGKRRRMLRVPAQRGFSAPDAVLAATNPINCYKGKRMRMLRVPAQVDLQHWTPY